MKLNSKGKELYDLWYQNYCKGNDKLGGNSADGDFVEGWSIIDNTDYIKTLTDVCGLLIFVYDNDAIYTVEDWIKHFEELTVEEIKAEIEETKGSIDNFELLGDRHAILDCEEYIEVLEEMLNK